MPELKNKKVGIIACSGEELPEGLVSRLVALRVLHDLQPGKTVTLCLPLFLAGGVGDRAFAKLYPTIAIDGCEKRCAFRATEKYSNKPAGSVVISEINAKRDGGRILGLRKLNPSGEILMKVISQEVSRSVDSLLVEQGDHSGQPEENKSELTGEVENAVGTCSCGSQIPVMMLDIDGQKKEMIALPLIFENFARTGRFADGEMANDLLEQAKIYTPLEPGKESEYKEAIMEAYKTFLLDQKKEKTVLIIKVLGIGCENCKKVEANTMDALAEMNVDADVVHVTEHDAIYAYPILGTPGLVINEKVVSAGRIPSKDEIKQFILQAK
jgi:small redox-active disulfide protein 2